MKTKNLIDTLTELLMDYTDAPKHFIKATSLFIISTTLGAVTGAVGLPSDPEGYFRPNLWFMLSGLPGLTRRSTLQAIARYIIAKVWENFLLKTSPGMTFETARERVSTMFIQTGSVEGLLEHISKNQETNRVFAIMVPEFGTILTSIKNSTYLADTINLLSSLYTGEEVARYYVKGRQYRIKPGIYFTALLSIQEPELYLEQFHFRQGLMRRIILVYARNEDIMERYKPLIDPARDLVKERIDNVINEIVERMYKYGRLEKPILVIPDHSAIIKINEYDKKIREQVLEEGLNLWALYASTRAIHMAKIALLYSVSGTTLEYKPEFEAYVAKLSTDHLDYALEFLNSIEDREKEAVMKCVAPHVEKPLQTLKTTSESVYMLIESFGEQGVNTRELLRRTKVYKDELKPLIKQLMEEEKIIATTRHTKGRPSIKFYASKYKNYIPPTEKIITPQMLEYMW